MELDECISGCYSCRDFSDKEVPLSRLWEIMDASCHAQSPANLQTWRFVIVRNNEKKEEIANASHHQMWMANAPVYIVFCSDVDKAEKLFQNRGRLYSTQALALTAQNAILKAHEIGLRTCWIGAFDEKAVQRILELPDNLIPEIILVVGNAGTAIRTTSHMRNELEKVTYFDKYNNTHIIPEHFNLNESIENIRKKTEKKVNSTVSKIKNLLKKK